MENKFNTPDIEDYEIEFDSEEKVNSGREKVDEKLWEKVERTGKKISFLQDILALYNYLSDNNVQWYRKSIVVGALIYFITPIDLIPDISPLIGYLDDLGVITAVLKYLGHELIPYYDN